MKSILVFCLCLISFSALAENFYITSGNKQDPRIIKIIETDTRIGFRYCDLRSRRCEVIGPRSSYSKADLKKRQQIEYARMVAIGAADAGIAVLAAMGGAYVAGAVVSKNVMILFLLKSMGIVGASVTVSQIVAWSTKALNPVTYYRNAQAAGAARAEQNLIRTDIESFKNSLENVLYRIH